MASSPEGRRLTEQHRLEQQQVRAAFLAEFIALWALLDTARLDETSPGWIRAVARAISVFRMRSAQTSVSYFVAFRQVEAPREPSGPPIIELPQLVVPSDLQDDVRPVRSASPPRRNAPARPAPRQPQRRTERTSAEPSRASSRERAADTATPRRQARVEFDFAEFERAARAARQDRRTRIVMPDLDFTAEDRAVQVSLEVTGPIAQKDKIRRAKLVDVARDESFTHAAGAASRHVLTGGRKSLLTLLDEDPQALGWARVTDGDPCAFCAMLASRGPVYRSREQAAFQPHDACACQPEPVYSRDSLWPGRAREFQELWRETTRGTSGRDSINAFRRAYEQQQRDQRRGRVA